MEASALFAQEVARGGAEILWKFYDATQDALANFCDALAFKRRVTGKQFVYHDTLDFQYTLSEDVDFCNKARDKGFKLFADCSIKCDHIGSYKFKV